MINMAVAVFLVLSSAVVLLTTAVDVEVLPPTHNGTFDVGIIITPGAEIDGLAYKPLANEIQSEFPGRMWVALLHNFPFDTPNPLDLGPAVDSAISKFKAAGFKGNNIFLAGHSLGGVFVGEYGLQNPDKLKGVLLFASYLTRSDRLRDYPVPVLTISGDLDGLTRITRIIDTFEELENETLHNPKPVSLIYSTPVIVMRGINHGHFASGDMPPNVKNHDIQVDDDITFAKAYQTITFHVVNFVIATLGEPVEKRLTALAGLKTAYFDTKTTMQPLSLMKSLDVNKDEHSATTKDAQRILLGQDLVPRVQVNDTEISEAVISFYEPEVKIHGSSAHIQTYTSVIMPFDPEDVSMNPQTPSEIQSVMKSKAGMIALLPNVSAGGDPLTCKDVNQYNYAIAVHAASDTVKQRAAKRQSPTMTFNEDVPSAHLPTWVASSLNLEYGENGTLDVTSYAYIVKPLPKQYMAGTHYCKLLSPYRAIEWLYLDSLKRSTN